MTIARRDSHRLSAEGAKAGAKVLGGRLTKEGDRYIINKVDVTALLEEMIDENVIVVLGAVNLEEKERVRTCITCGEEYTGSECTRCARIRNRLRGDSKGAIRR